MSGGVSASGSPALVLIVEDDADLREAIAEVMELSGYRARCAADGHEALRVLRAGDEQPLAILLDLMMPRMSGPELLAVLHADDALGRIPVVVITASTHIDLDGLGARAVLRKPVAIPALLQTLAALSPPTGTSAS